MDAQGRFILASAGGWVWGGHMGFICSRLMFPNFKIILDLEKSCKNNTVFLYAFYKASPNIKVLAATTKLTKAIN